MTLTAPRSNRVVADHYEIEDQPIGTGGMALVYRGRDLRTRRDVALKTLKPEWVNDAHARARFRHEARTMAFLSHPNVARVYDLFEPNDQAQPWVVLEFVPGLSLRQEIDRNGPIDIDRLTHLLKQIAAALHHLHQRGMVHLDVKPQNILFDDPMTVKLIDFGIAQEAGTVLEASNGQAFGTVSYVSPEQASGDEVGPASDIYSLGCVVYEMVTGETIFKFRDGTDPQIVLAAHLTEHPIPPTRRRPDLDLPEWIDDIVLDALARAPEDRYPTTVAFAEAFEGALNAATPPDSTVPLSRLPRFDPRRNPTVVHTPPPVVGARIKGPPLVARIRTAFLWKLVGIVAVGNLLLAALSFWDTGVVPGLYDPAVAIHAGTTVTVTAELLNVRAEPSDSGAVLDQVGKSATLRVTGLPDGGWWPITYDRGDQQVEGWVSGDHVAGVPESGYERVRQVFRDLAP
ncbi:MAG TPA: serine/threonine protein kinase [Thermomicrobiales bacterium]|nr:serine/threonine protein kinase [Thermomicrobiales bacterium]